MSSYTVNYDELDPMAKHNKAIQDIKDYLGESQFFNLTDRLLDNWPQQPELEQFVMAVSFAGIQGYPAKAWYNYCYPL